MLTALGLNLLHILYGWCYIAAIHDCEEFSQSMSVPWPCAIAGCVVERLCYTMPLAKPPNACRRFIVAAKKWHPDKHTGGHQALAADNFRKVKEAYEDLKR